METALHISAAILLIMTLLPFSRIKHWSVRSLDFPRVQITCCALAVLICQGWFLNLDNTVVLFWLAMTVFCLIIQVWWIAPYTIFWPKEVASCDTSDRSQLSILTANVYTPNRNATALLNLVDELQPDILVTLESDHWWEEQLDVLTASMPFTIKCPKDNLYGMHVYSSLPLQDPSIEFLVEDDVPSMHAKLKMPDNRWTHLHFIHPAPPSPTENEKSTQRDAELILIAQRVTNAPTVVTGDLNDVAWSSTTRLFRKISGLLDPRVGRGMFNTFHASIPIMRWPLDHAFHSRHFTLGTIRRLPSIGSDHFPLLTRLVYLPENDQNEATLQSSEYDKTRAADIVEQKNDSNHKS